MLNLRSQRIAGDGVSSSRNAVQQPFPGARLVVRSPRQSSAAAFNRPGPPDAPSVNKLGLVGKEWLETIISRFAPVKDRAQTVTVLEFEKPLIELDKRICEVCGPPPQTQPRL